MNAENPDNQKKSSLTRNVFHGLGWSYLSAGMQAILQLAIVGVLAHILDPKAFGILGIALIFTNIAERLGQLGVGPALVQRESLDQEHLDVAHTLSILLGITVALLFVIVAPLIASFFHEPDLSAIVRVLSVIFVMDGLIVVADSTLQRELRFKDMAKIENLSYLIGAGGVGIGSALLGCGVWSLVYSQLSQRLIKMLLFRWLVPVKVSWRLARQPARDLLSKGFGFSAGRLMSFVALYGDNFVVGRLLGSSALGVYSRAYQLMTLPSTYVGQMADRVLFPALSNRQRDIPAMRQAMLLLIEVLALVSLPISAVMIFTAPEIIQVLLGSQWTDAVLVLQILAYGVFFRAGYKCGDTISRSLGVVYRHASIQALYSICVIAGAYAGSGWGLEGVSTGVLIAVAVNYLAMSHLALKLVGLRWRSFLAAHLSGLWIALWCGLGCFLLMPLLREWTSLSVIRLAAVGISCGVLSLSAWILMPRFIRGPLSGWLRNHCPPKWKAGRFGPIISALS